MAGQETPRGKRPVLVWIIFLFYLVSSIQVIVSMFFIAAGGTHLTPEQQTLIAQFTLFDRVVGYVNAGITIIGVTLLFMFRRQAVAVLALAFLLNLFSTAVIWMKTDIAAHLSGQGILAQISGLVIFGLVVLYAWRLKRRGVLSATGHARTRPRK